VPASQTDVAITKEGAIPQTIPLVPTILTTSMPLASDIAPAMTHGALVPSSVSGSYAAVVLVPPSSALILQQPLVITVADDAPKRVSFTPSVIGGMSVDDGDEEIEVIRPLSST